MIIEYNNDNPIVLGKEPVLLDFYANWCGPCKVTSNNLMKFSDAHPDVKIYKINVDEQEKTAETWKVQSLPTIICENLKGEIWRHNGLITVKQLEEKMGIDA